MKKPKTINKGQSKMTASEIKKYQQIVADVGSRKIKGFMSIFIAKDDSTGVRTSGIVFGNDVAKRNVLINVIRGLGMNPLEVLLVLNEMQKK